jgi:uncharacterized protein
MNHSIKRAFDFRRLPGRLAVVRLDPGTVVPQWANRGSISSIVRRPDEMTVVCDESVVPEECRAERNWVALELAGPFPFAITGVLASFLGPLAEAGVSVFVISTHDTDVVLVKEDQAGNAVKALEHEGHRYLGAGT